MMARSNILLVLCWLMVFPGVCLGIVKPSWRLDLKETSTVKGGIAKLSDLTTGPLPAGIGDVVIVAGGKPGTIKAISSRMILRKLVTRGMSSGVKFSGAQWSQVTFTGAESTAEELRPRIRALIQPLVPVSVQGAPNSWFEMDLPETSFSFHQELFLTCKETKKLTPGRNTLRISLHDGSNKRDFQVIVTFHAFDEIGTAVTAIPRSNSLEEGDFNWEWKDLADMGHGIVIGREMLLASSAARNIKAGHVLREADLKNTPVILAGDKVDLCITRGSLEVIVKGVARHAGSLGQVIAVKNVLNGKLINATVSGPGLVQWRN